MKGLVRQLMLDICSSIIRGDVEEISITEVKSSGQCILNDKDVFQRFPRVKLLVQVDLVMCKDHSGLNA